MLLRRSRSLKSLILTHEIAFLLLAGITGLISGASAYFWNKSSAESIRINDLSYLNEQIRSELYIQIQEVIRAYILEGQRTLAVYIKYSRSIDDRFNSLRQKTTSKEEALAVQDLQHSYRKIQKDMNQIFNDSYIINRPTRIRILNPAFAQQLVGQFEQNYYDFKDLLAVKYKQLDAALSNWARFAPLVIPLPLLLPLFLVMYTRSTVKKGIINPMLSIAKGAKIISRRKLDYRIAAHGVAEVSQLATTLNMMAADLARSRDALVEKEKQAALGSLVPVVAHNIRNPLASIRATAQLLSSANDEAELDMAQKNIIDTIDRLGRWVNALVSYLHPLKPNLETIQASKLLLVTLALLENKIKEKDIRIVKTAWENDCVLAVDPDLMEQVFYGVMLNAIDASPKSAILELKLGIHEESIEFHIIDNGPGLPFKPQPVDLEPGPSTKRFGTGLGIPIAFKICQAHGWSIRFERAKTAGTVVIITAPISKNKV